MEHSSPVSKIVATATASSWAQAYSAGKLHLVLSFKGKDDKNIASLGKDTLERLQREFFALDEKNLSDLKKVVETVVSELDKEIETSLVLTTIVNDTLYIVIYNSGIVFLKRGGSVTTIGLGEENQITGFSGTLNPRDIILVATQGLLDTVSFENIEKSLYSMSPHEVSESLAPFIHGSSSGTEAALIWNMIGPRKVNTEEEGEDFSNDTLELSDVPEKENARKLSIPNFGNFLEKLRGKLPKSLSRKQIIILTACILVLILLGSIFYETVNRENKKQENAAQAVIDANKQKYDDAVALITLNKSLAVEELQGVKQDVENKRPQFPPGSNALKTLDSFLSRVDNALQGAGAGPSQINVFFDAAKSSGLPTVTTVTDKGGQLTAAGDGKGATFNSDGTINKTFDNMGNASAMTQDDKNIYVLSGNSVDMAPLGGGSGKTIIDKQANPVSIDTFGGNVYLLSKTDKTIYKYVPNSYDKSTYFVGDVTLTNPSSMTIDASIYTIDNGKIIKFTRGKADTFSYQGKTLSQNAQVYTDTDFSNLYVLDPSVKKVYIIDKSGNPVSEISLAGITNPTSIAADESGKKIYVASDNKIYSISF